MPDDATPLEPRHDALVPLRALIAALPEPVMLVSPAGVVLAANPAADELFGVALAGARVRAHLRQPDAAAMLDRALAPDAAPDVAHTALMIVGSASAETTWQITARRLGADAAGLDGVIVSLHDISHRAAAEAQRRDFIANVSHELRSPLTVLAGFIETLQDAASEDPVARAEFLDIMARETRRMAGLVADLLSLSRLEGSERIRPRDPVSIVAVLRATLAALRPQVEAAGLDIDWQVPDDLPQVPGDHDQLVQVFHNLLENALKYGAGGGSVSIIAETLPRFPGVDGPALRVSVIDRGDGVDPIHIPRLTERFYRVDRARSREQGGTGLGLAIVKHILNRHRGRLIIRSTPGAGCRFDAVVPASCAAPPVAS